MTAILSGHRGNHDLLLTLLGRKIRDKRLINLISRYLRAGCLLIWERTTSALERAEKVFHKMTPNDHKEAPLLANIMLDPLDKELKKRSHKFARYAMIFPS